MVIANCVLVLQTHHLQEKYNFHAYMIRCMEDEFETIVGIRYMVHDLSTICESLLTGEYP
jgi:hypothetical protein